LAGKLKGYLIIHNGYIIHIAFSPLTHFKYFPFMITFRSQVSMSWQNNSLKNFGNEFLSFFFYLNTETEINVSI